MWQLEGQHRNAGWLRIAGVDEAGRGALAGPVAVGAVILPADWHARAYRDSKTLSPVQRDRFALEIKLEAVAWAVEFAPALEVDEYGVLNATKRASLRALARLEPQPDALITDFLTLETALPLLAPPRADGNSYSVAAASILAKTMRDAHMLELDQQFPEYGFAGHKGYGAASHLGALQTFGACSEHRRSFRPVALVVDGLFSRAIGDSSP